MSHVEAALKLARQRDPDQPEFLQAVEEVLESLESVMEAHPEFVEAKILERMVEPERLLQFRVPWVDDSGKVHVNRGFRIQFNGAIAVRELMNQI